MRKLIVLSICGLLLNCGSQKKEKSSSGVESDSKSPDHFGSYYVLAEADLPECNDDRLNALAYVKKNKAFHSCDGGVWSPVEIDTGKNSLIAIKSEEAGSNCPAGGKAIQSGVDLDVDGSLQPAEVSATEYVCNGTNGTNGTSSKITGSIYCGGFLQNQNAQTWSNIGFNYKAAVMDSGDIFVTGSIYDAVSAVSNTNFFSVDQVGSDTARVSFVNDFVAPTNSYGYWELSVNRNTLITTIIYNDSTLPDGKLTWVMTADKCIVNDY